MDTHRAPMEAADRIAELEAELKQRDAKIKELTTERDEAQELVDRMREHVADADRMIEQWIEAFDMMQDEKGLLITHYPQLSSHGTKQERTAVSAGLNDGAQQGAISKGAQRGPVCCSLRNRGSVPGG